MKKQFVRLAALVMCALMCVSLAACGGQKDSVQDQDNQKVEGTDGDKNLNGTADGSTNDGQESTSLEDYLASIRDEIDAQIAALGDDMKLAVEADGNKLVYSYQYAYDVAESLGVDINTVKEALDVQLVDESVISQFQDVLSELKKVVPSAEAVVVKYLNADGSEITSKEFK